MVEIVRLCDGSRCLLLELEDGNDWIRCWISDSSVDTERLRMGAELLINIKQRFLSTLRMTKEELEEKAKTSAYGKLLGVTGLADPHWYVYVSLSQDDRVFQFYDAQMSLRASMTVSPDLIPIWINTLDQLENS